MLNDIKKVLGITNTDFDAIINSFILACKSDLKQIGIIEAKIIESDPLIYSAIMSYVLSHLDTYEYKELSANSYALQKDALRHYADYIS